MILDDEMTVVEAASHTITGTCYVAGTLSRAGVPGAGQVLLFARETAGLAASKNANSSGVFRIQTVAGSGNPITSTADPVMVLGRDFLPVSEGASLKDDITLEVV